MTPGLSILICHLPAREALLARLMALLNAQRDPRVEVLVNADRGEKPTGRKRNELLRQASGRYIAFIDDDDLVADDYVPRILGALESSPDCVGIEGIITRRGRNPRKFVHTRECTHWHERDGVYYRTPNHLNPVKRELALQTGFPEKTVGEDHDYSKRLKPLLGSEVYLAGPLYYYLAETA